jgi:hypothetical protein
MRTLILAIVLAGCGVDGAVDDGYRATLDSLPSVGVTYSERAVSIVAESMGINRGDITSITWVVGGVHDEHGNGVGGVSIGCDVWVAWIIPQWTSGASADGPAISHSNMAHEVAHCALGLLGDRDGEHMKSEWWAGGGRVAMANLSLVGVGL